MGYIKIKNLYKDQTILLFKHCYAMEKIHGTSARITWHGLDGNLTFSSGGAKHETFVSIFDTFTLHEKFKELGHDNVVIYGEAYGGKMRRMSESYGKELKFAVFEVKVGDFWLSVPNAADVAGKLGLEFVHYAEVSTNLDELNHQRDADSVQAVRNGIGEGKMREGVVLRPLQEFVDLNGNRIIAKHKRDDFKETRTPREVSPEKQAVLAGASDIAMEWVTDMRLRHVLDKFPDVSMKQTRDVIAAMIEDVQREGEGEIADSSSIAVQKAIGKRTAILLKAYLAAQLQDNKGEER